MSPDAERRRRELMPGAPADVDLSVLPLCRMFGHVLEGRVVDLEPASSPRVELYLIGRCSRCGLGMMTDGS
jgi:hypothetical protein